jgi:hypothetical protein
MVFSEWVVLGIFRPILMDAWTVDQLEIKAR